MIRRIYQVAATECTKALRLKSTLIGPAIVSAAVLLAPFAYPIRDDEVSDYGFLGYALPLAVNLVGQFAVIVFSASLVSREVGSGTIRLILVRPVLRHEILAGKIATGILYAVFLNACAVVTAFALVLVAGNLHGVHFGGELLFTDQAMLQTLAACLGLGLLSQCAAVAYGILFSTLSRSAATSTLLAVGVWLLLEGVKHPARIGHGLYTTHAELPWDVFNDRCNGFAASFFPDAAVGMGVSMASFTVFAGLACWLFVRKDLTP